MVFDRSHANGLAPHLVTLITIVGWTLVTQEVRATVALVEPERLVDATAIWVMVALALGNGERGLPGQLGHGVAVPVG